jgi:hypothetical protein
MEMVFVTLSVSNYRVIPLPTPDLPLSTLFRWRGQELAAEKPVKWDGQIVRIIKTVKRIIMREVFNNKDCGAEEGIDIWKKRTRSV